MTNDNTTQPRVSEQADERAIYAASRASVPARPQMWQSLRAQGWPINSTWIDEAGEGETRDFRELWQRIHDEIAASCGVILYAEESDFPLKGAYVECGMALGMGKPVAVVLKFPLMDRSMRPLGSWANHPLVKLCQSLDQARRYVQSVDIPALTQQAAPVAPTARVTLNYGDGSARILLTPGASVRVGTHLYASPVAAPVRDLQVILTDAKLCNPEYVRAYFSSVWTLVDELQFALDATQQAAPKAPTTEPAPKAPHWIDGPQDSLGGRSAREGYAANPLYGASPVAAPEAPALLSVEEMAALRRFDECAQDGESYDVPKAMMQRLAEIGVVQRRSGNFYQATEFGQLVLGQHVPPAAAPEVTKTLDAASMVNRFLGWRLPQDFYPDCGITFKHNETWGPYPNNWPTGTNLFTADQAKAMFEYVLATPATAPEASASLAVQVEENRRLTTELNECRDQLATSEESRHELLRLLNEETGGPTFMGEPVIPAATTASAEMTAEQARATLLAMPLETVVDMVQGAATASAELPRAIGVSRDAESPGGKGVLVAFERQLSDDQLRALHGRLSATTASASGEAEEAAKLQTLLTEEFACYRPTWPAGLYAWARIALLDNSPHHRASATAPSHEAAPQIKTWQERMGPNYIDGGADLPEEVALKAEIADLRAALAQQGAAQAAHVGATEMIEIGNRMAETLKVLAQGIKDGGTAVAVIRTVDEWDRAAMSAATEKEPK